ncbi:hypothetical protein ABE85_15635 [Mitsuaria sp. 7]|nr:hypothetical protein ABE85_15635 [Mitsuaria sp. 7]
MPRRVIPAGEADAAARAAAGFVADLAGLAAGLPTDWRSRRAAARRREPAGIVPDLDRLDFSPLHHELSPYIAQREPRQCARYGVSVLEAASLRTWERAVDGRQIALPDLLALGRHLGPGIEIRSHDIFGADQSGARVIRFCDAATAVSRLTAHLESVTETGDDILRLARALFEYVLVNNLHCFKDGNGRLSRILLNHRLDRILGPGDYLPLKEAFLHSRGGYEITLRIVELHRDWTPFVTYMMRLLGLLMAPRVGRAA